MSLFSVLGAASYVLLQQFQLGAAVAMPSAIGIAFLPRGSATLFDLRLLKYGD